MERVVVNALGKARTVYEGGREYLVAPATMIVPGVLNGSKGALYYSPEDTGRDPSSWDGMPLTVYHPSHPVTGAPLSASDPGVVERQGIGEIKNTRFDGKLRTEAWFDVERTRNHDRLLSERGVAPILPRLKAGIPVEMSTGLYTQNVPAAPGSNHKGKPYDAHATRHVPDHLAVLPDQVGACSINDGCGVLVNTEGGDGRWITTRDGNHLFLKDGALHTSPGGEQVTQGKGSPKAEGKGAKPSSKEVEQKPVWEGDIRRTVTPKFGYHVTDADNLASIAAVGLKPSAPQRSMTGKGVYFADKDQFGKHQDEEQHESEVSIRARIPEGHHAYDDSEVHEYNGSKGDPRKARENSAFYTPLGIPPENLEVLDHVTRKATPLKEYVKQKGIKPEAALGFNRLTEKGLTMNEKLNLLQRFLGWFATNGDPSDDIPASKACQILHDKEVRGHPLTEKQRGMFGAALVGSKCKGGELQNKVQNVRDYLVNVKGMDPAEADDLLKNARQHVETGQFLPDGGSSQKQTHSAASKGYGGKPPGAESLGPPNEKGDDGRDIDSVDKPQALEKMAEADEPDDHTAQAILEGQRDMERDGAGGQKVNVGKTDNADQPRDEMGRFSSGGGGGGGTSDYDLGHARGYQRAKEHIAKHGSADEAKGKPDEDEYDAGHNRGWNKAVKEHKSKTNNQGTVGMGQLDTTPSPHDMTKQAAGASLMSEHDPAREHALGALDHSKGGNPKKAASTHLKAAEAHEAAATDARKNKDPQAADTHDSAAALHRKAASMHVATVPTPAPTQPVANQEYEVTTNELKALVANCSCASTKAQLQRILNEKAEGSNADTTGTKGGTVQAGGEETTDEHDYESKPTPGTSVTIKKKAPEMNAEAWFASAPPAVQSVFRSALRVQNEQKAALARRLVANLAEARREPTFNKLMKLELDDLRERVDMMPAVNSSPWADVPAPSYLGAAGGPEGVTSNVEDSSSADVLPLPTMNWEDSGGLWKNGNRVRQGTEAS